MLVVALGVDPSSLVLQHTHLQHYVEVKHGLLLGRRHLCKPIHFKLYWVPACAA